MNNDTLKGMVVGIILALLIGYGILYAINLNARLTGVERFLIAVQNQSQQTQSQVQHVPGKS